MLVQMFLEECCGHDNWASGFGGGLVSLHSNLLSLTQDC